MKRNLCFVMIALITVCMLSSCTDASNEDTGQDVSVSTDDTSESDDTTENSDIDISAETYKLGDTVSTDITECTLELCQFAIALENSYGDDYLTPKEYDATDDAKNPYVASVGHTLVSFTLIVTNLNRTSLDIDTSIITAIYDGEEYSGSIYSENARLGATSSDNINWTSNDTLNLIISASDTVYIRGYMDIPVEVSDLTESLDVRITLEQSNEEEEYYTYHVTSEDNEEQSNKEISLEAAIERFTKTKGQEYFKNHMDEYSVLTGSEVAQIVISKTNWNIEEKNTNGSTWSGKFAFEDDGNIKETIYDGSVGYFNSRTWKIDGDTIVLSHTTTKGEVIEDVCEVRLVKEDVYLFTMDGAPYILMR